MAASLDSFLAERGLSVRAAARILANGSADEKQLERWRRALARYRGGAEPEDETATLMEDRFGLERGYFPRVDRSSRRRDRIDDRLELLETGVAEVRAEIAELRAAAARIERLLSG